MKKIVLITGGSSGIGYATSRHFAKAGFHLLWVSIVEEELEESKRQLEEEFPDCSLDFLCLDLSREEAADKVFAWTQENNWQVDVLINNAGIGTYGYLQETSKERELSMLHLNILAVYKLTRLYLDDMVSRNSGTIINISSNSSFHPSPLLLTYSSTKAFVKHFTRGLNTELKMQNSAVQAICICPAAISNTQFRKAGKMDRVKTFHSGLATTTVEEVAKDIWRAFSQKKSYMVSGWKMRIIHSFLPFIPYSLKNFLIKREVKLVP